MIGEDGRETKKREKSQKSCRRDVENGRDSGGRRKNRKQESNGSIDVDPEDLNNYKICRERSIRCSGLK